MANINCLSNVNLKLKLSTQNVTPVFTDNLTDISHSSGIKVATKSWKS